MRSFISFGCRVRGGRRKHAEEGVRLRRPSRRRSRSATTCSTPSKVFVEKTLYSELSCMLMMP